MVGMSILDSRVYLWMRIHGGKSFSLNSMNLMACGSTWTRSRACSFQSSVSFESLMLKRVAGKANVGEYSEKAAPDFRRLSSMPKICESNLSKVSLGWTSFSRVALSSGKKVRGTMGASRKVSGSRERVLVKAQESGSNAAVSDISGDPCSRDIEEKSSDEGLNRTEVGTVNGDGGRGRDQQNLNNCGDSIKQQGWEFGAPIKRDILRKLPHYKSDFADGLHPKAVSSIFFLFFACLAPCMAFGGLISSVTAGSIGVVEMIVGASVAGILYALTAGQPLTLIGPTGLMVVYSGLLYKVTCQLSLPFLPIYGWVGIWSCLFLITLAAIGASDLIQHFTRFTDETFSSIISLGYISEACKSVGKLFKTGSPFTTDTALLSLILAGGTWALASSLTQLRNSRLFLRPVRNALSDFGPPLAILVMSSMPRIMFRSVSLPELVIPATFSTTSGRPWLVPLLSIPTWAIAASVIPAAFLTLLIFLDQNLTTKLVNRPENMLCKGEAYHLDLAVLGVLMGLGSFFGLPWMFASTVPSLSHVRSLATMSKSIHISGDNAEAPDELVVGVQENRVTGAFIHVCIGVSLLLLSVLRQVPIPVTDGLFFYMGMNSLSKNQFVERLKLWFCDPELYPEQDFTQGVPRNVVHTFTSLQLACVGVFWTLKQSPYGIAFPLLILALVPVRNYAAASFVSLQYLSVMDAHN